MSNFLTENGPDPGGGKSRMNETNNRREKTRFERPPRNSDVRTFFWCWPARPPQGLQVVWFDRDIQVGLRIPISAEGSWAHSNCTYNVPTPAENL